MKKKIVVLIGTMMTLSGCATSDTNIFEGWFDQGVVGNKNYVTITNVRNEMKALPLAEKHCSEHGRSARFNKMEGHRAVFDCID
jgi:hypothetical protein